MTIDVAALASDNFDLWTSAIERKASGGRERGKRLNQYGIEKLRALVLGLAVRGKLVPQNPQEEPATALISKIADERHRRIKSGDIKDSNGPSNPISEPFVLPPGWVWLPLWKTGNIFTGNSINASLRSELEKNEIGRPFVATKDVGYGLEPIDYENGLVVALDDQRFTVAKPHSVFICAEGGSAGRKMAVSDREISFGNKLIANEPWSVIEPRYVLYTYLSDFFFECFSKEMTGIIGGISRAKFLALPFPLPPLAEQRRIVAKVDELMALCDALETQSASAQDAHQTLVEALLSTLVHASDSADLGRQWTRLEAHFDALFTTDSSVEALKNAILDLAVRGKLVEQDTQDRPTSELLLQQNQRNTRRRGRAKQLAQAEQLLREIPFEIPSQWHWATLGDLACDMRYGTSKKCDRDETLTPVLRIPNVSGGRVTFDDLKYGPLTEKERSDLNLQPGDLLIIRSNGSLDIVGRFAVVPELSRAFTFAGYLVRMRPDTSRIVPRYLWLVSNSGWIRESIEGPIRHGVGLKNLNLTELSSLRVPVPSIVEQKRVIAKVDELMELCDALNTGLAAASQTRKHLADAVVERASA